MDPRCRGEDSGRWGGSVEASPAWCRILRAVVTARGWRETKTRRLQQHARLAGCWA